MKALSFFVIIFLFCLTSVFSQNKKLKVYFNTVQFQAPGIGNYIELHFQFDAKSIRFVNIDNDLQAKISLDVEIKDSLGKSMYLDAYTLLSPKYTDSIVEDFYELKRIPIEPGTYQINLKLSDLNEKKSLIQGSQLIQVYNFKSEPCISQIEAIDFAFQDTTEGIYQKNGYYIFPKISNYYGTLLNNLPIYFELNNLKNQSDSIFYLEQELINSNTKTVLINYTTSSTIREKEEVLPFIRDLDISKLPSGEYGIHLTLSDQNRKLISSQVYIFERGNFIADDTIDATQIVLDPAFQNSITEDSLFFYLGALLPISNAVENKRIRALLKLKDKAYIRKYIQAYWNESSPQNPVDAWLKYKQQIQYVQQIFKSNYQSGYETDRGRVYLKYGAPSTINARENSPTEYPYEIWFYNKIGSFSNKRFIFYNPDLVNNTYRLLHSDLIGEVKNPGWSQILSKRNTNNGTVDDPNLFNQKHWGQNSNDLFRQY